MDFMLRDKVVLMTGGAEGIDAATEGQTGRFSSETCCTATTWHTMLSLT
jgi:hypothetical protein